MARIRRSFFNMQIIDLQLLEKEKGHLGVISFPGHREAGCRYQQQLVTGLLHSHSISIQPSIS